MVAAAVERARRRGGRRRAARGGGGDSGGEAEPELLRVVVPQRGDAGPRRRDAEAAGDLQRRARHAPPLLPRLLRQGLRRVGADLGSRRRAQRGRGHDAVAGRAGPHHPRQGRRGGQLRQQGLLRRRPRHRHTRHRLAGWRSVLPGGAGAAGRQGRDARRGEAQPPWPRQHPGPAQQALRPQRPHTDRHDRALRWAHDRRDALRQVRAPLVPVQGRRHQAAAEQPADEPGLPAADAGHLPAQLQPVHGGHARRRHAPQVRQRILPDAAAAEGPAGLGPGALRRPPLQGHRQPLRRQPDRILRRIRRRHGQARTHRGQDRRTRRRDTPGMHQGQLMHMMMIG